MVSYLWRLWFFRFWWHSWVCSWKGGANVVASSFTAGLVGSWDVSMCLMAIWSICGLAMLDVGFPAGLFNHHHALWGKMILEYGYGSKKQSNRNRSFENIFGTYQRSVIFISSFFFECFLAQSAKNRMASQKPDPETGKLPWANHSQPMLTAYGHTYIYRLFRWINPTALIYVQVRRVFLWHVLLIWQCYRRYLFSRYRGTLQTIQTVAGADNVCPIDNDIDRLDVFLFRFCCLKQQTGWYSFVAASNAGSEVNLALVRQRRSNCPLQWFFPILPEARVWGFTYFGKHTSQWVLDPMVSEYPSFWMVHVQEYDQTRWHKFSDSFPGVAVTPCWCFSQLRSCRRCDLEEFKAGYSIGIPVALTNMAGIAGTANAPDLHLLFVRSALTWSAWPNVRWNPLT